MKDNMITLTLPTSAINMELAMHIPAYMEEHSDFTMKSEEDALKTAMPVFDDDVDEYALFRVYDDYDDYDYDDDITAPVKKQRGERRRRSGNARKAYKAVCQFAGWKKSRFSQQTKVDRCTYDMVCKQTAVAKELRALDLANRQYLGTIDSSEFVEETVVPDEEDFWDYIPSDGDVAQKCYNLSQLPMEKILRIAEFKGISTEEVRDAYEMVFAKLIDAVSVDESEVFYRTLV